MVESAVRERQLAVEVEHAKGNPAADIVGGHVGASALDQKRRAFGGGELDTGTGFFENLHGGRPKATADLQHLGIAGQRQVRCGRNLLALVIAGGDRSEVEGPGRIAARAFRDAR